MSRLSSLVRAGLKSNFGLSLIRHRLFKEKKDRWLVPVFGLAALSVLPLLYGIVRLIRGLYGLLQPLGQERALLTFGILAGQLFILLFGLYYVISAFYFSRDLEMLIPLPLKPFEVLFSKFAVILVNEYLTVMVFVLPVLVTYGVAARAGFPYWINAVLVYLFLPVIPLAVVSILVVAMMRLVNVGRKKDALILVGSLVLIALGLGVQVLVNGSAGKEMDGRAMAAFFASPDSLLIRVGAKFPPSIWATKALAGGFSGAGLANLALFLGTSLAFFAAILVLAEKLFYRGLVGLGEAASRRKALSGDELSRKVSAGSRPAWAIFVREWRLMNRTPIFLLNGVFSVVLIPVIFILMFSTGNKASDASHLLLLIRSADPTAAVLAVALFMTISGSINGTASSTFSREGSQFWISKVVPVAPAEQVKGKFLHSYLVAVLGVVAAGAAASVFFRLTAGVLAAAAGLALAAGFVLTAAGMIIDLARPLLDWTNPQKAIKQNLNVLFAVLADFGFLTVLFFVVRFLFKAGLARTAVLVILFALLAVLSVGSFVLLLRFAEKRYGEIEV